MVLLREARENKIKGRQSFDAPAAFRQNRIEDLDGTVTTSGRGIVPCQPYAKGFYAAVDIGTTTLSVEVYDQDGVYRGGCAEYNEQGSLGSDVMMRLMHTAQGRQKILCQMIRDQIHRILQQILSETARFPGGTDEWNGMQQIRQVSVVGNSAMCHLFLDQDTAGLRGSPFHTAYQGSCQLTGQDLGWYDCSGAGIVVLPGIASHVGADAAAVLWAEQLWQEDRVQLAVDLGTNAEILLNNRGTLCVCSAAAGPAFEGRGISCGCRGTAGAVSGVHINRANGNILLDILPDMQTGMLQPAGLCGSGLVDLIAVLLDQKLLQPDGYLISAREAGEQGIHASLAGRLQETEGGRRFVVYDPGRDKIAGADHMSLSSIYITQQDIRQYQMAKGAIQTGIALLCRRNHLDISQIEDCRVAGVFGASLHPDSAKRSGLLPDLPASQIHFVGNAAGRGAVQSLFDPDMLPQLEKKIQTVHHVELAQEQGFQSQYLENMALCPWSNLQH